MLLNFLGSSKVMSILRIYVSSSYINSDGSISKLESFYFSLSHNSVRLIFNLITGTEAVCMRILDFKAKTLFKASWSICISSIISFLDKKWNLGEF
jgi:hypothetical protein